MRYGYKYSVRAHARGHDRYTAQAVHAIKLYVYKYNVRAQTRVPKHKRYRCTCTSTSCEPRHVDLSTVGASPRLSMQYTPRAYENRCIASAFDARTLCKLYKHSTYVQVQALMYTTYTTQAAHTIYCTTHAYTFSRRVVQHSGCTGRPLYTHTYTCKIHCLDCPSRTPYRMYTRGKYSAQAPV